MTKLFISYRRVDAYEANRLVKALRQEYGESNIFYDVASIELGDNWPESLENALNEASAIIILIGPNWLHLQDKESGKRRIDLKNDWVRKEVIKSIQRKVENPDLLIIPLLTGDVSMPKRNHLDDELKPVCDFQAMTLKNTGHIVDFVAIKNKLISSNIFRNSPLPVVTPVMTDMPNRLSNKEEEAFLIAFNQWNIIEQEKPGNSNDVIKELYRVFEFISYEGAFDFMKKVDEYGIRPFNHHPRIQNTYNRVEIWLCTFNIGHKPSYRDIRLAKICEKLYKESIS